MKRSVALPPFLLLVLALAGQAGPAQGGSSPKDITVGGATFGDSFQQDLEVSAHSGPAGEDPRGMINYHDSAGDTVFASVTCLRVSGKDADIGGRVVRSSIAGLVGKGFLVAIRDNGGPNDPTPDLAQIFGTDAPPATCPHNVASVPRTHGNYTVIDG